jgi:signal transduction histidine kinase
VNLTQLLQRILREMASELNSRQLSVQYLAQGLEVPSPADLPAMGDELLCYSMFSNLFKNAMEAAGQNTVIRIDMQVVDDWAQVAISNDGAVPLDVRDRFFDKFSTFGKPEGTGLGTYSAQLIATTQQGSIAMDTSDAPPHTTLTVRLPYALQADVQP